MWCRVAIVYACRILFLIEETWRPPRFVKCEDLDSQTSSEGSEDLLPLPCKARFFKAVVSGRFGFVCGIAHSAGVHLKQ